MAKKLFGGAARQPGDISLPRETIYYGERSFPESEQLVLWIEGLLPFDGKIRFPTNYVDRGREHTLAWITAFMNTEQRLLNRDFSEGTGKSFSVKVERDEESMELLISFYLTTDGIKGHTTFAISILRYKDDDGDDGFICVE